MKVIRHGNLFQPFPLRIVCRGCGCLYEAEEDDAKFTFSANGPDAKYLRVVCPECGEEYKSRIVIDQ